MTIDLLGPDPIYQQIAAILAGRIETGTYPANRAIPSGPAIAAEFSVSRRTANQAVDVLKARGLVRGVRGRGVFVLPEADRPDGATQ